MPISPVKVNSSYKLLKITRLYQHLGGGGGCLGTRSSTSERR